MKEELSLSELFDTLKRHIGKIIIWSLIGLITLGIYTFFFVVPQYQSTSKIVVNQTQQTGQAITNTDIQTNLNLINTYQSIIKEPIILEEVIGKINSVLTTQELSNKLSIQTDSASLVFGVTISDADPYVASELANAIAETFQEKIGDILEVESVTILSQAIPSVNPVSPNIPMNLAIGLILGLMIGVGTAFLSGFLDKRVKDSKLIEDMGWTNLGSVLEMSHEELKDTRMMKQVRVNMDNKSQLRRRV
ncbi:putative capsular polysaccharide biosynthesis protein YwqC [Jeotgalibaca dankookensis]|uniref:Capsular polysaccharide biosynthesis protein CpsC n=1 Tax=Jeotgalibaca dankookensis TaxID=708126 RepID=A0A1S6IMA5_9LACT|nr:Wzz/FepE/Etk N-terminal domain-containing protein [Jeotgalibaca dankookensis]AQS52649.1 putative capsular polysaccharide biosynthesis protein YwqC [Jeotgalibaca dankookensis]